MGNENPKQPQEAQKPDRIADLPVNDGDTRTTEDVRGGALPPNEIHAAPRLVPPNT